MTGIKIKKYIFMMGLLWLANTFAWSQTHITTNQHQITLTQNKSAIICFVNSAFDVSTIPQNKAIEKVEKHPDNDFLLLWTKQTWKGNFEQLAMPKTQITSWAYGLDLEDGTTIFPNEKIILKLAEGYTTKDIESLLLKHQLSLIDIDLGNNLILQSKDANKSIEIGNQLTESPLVEWAESDYIVEVVRTNDPLYNEQYYLNNTGQVIDGSAATFDVDIDAREAWNITKGNNTITVAVIDEGVGLHEDLVDAQGNTKLLSGYDATPNNSSNPGYPLTVWDNHGQACAGIIAATHNNGKGIKGIAPKINLLPIRIRFGSIPTSEYANAINWAWQNGADVLSNSWGSRTCHLFSNSLTGAIQDAQQHGRNGKGSVVVFSAGNDNQSCISYPANIGGVIAVGALDKTGHRASYSNYGQKLSVAAIGGYGGSAGDIRTIDRMGNAGYHVSNYMNNFNGTSAACPQVAGVAALILSVNADLNANEVKCRIEQTATDIGNLGTDLTYGNGRLNAYYAAALDNLDIIDDEIKGQQHYRTKQVLTTGTGTTIKNTAKVTLSAEGNVQLLPGFSTENGCRFIAKIDHSSSCNSNPLSNAFPVLNSVNVFIPPIDRGAGGVTYPPTNPHENIGTKDIIAAFNIYPNPVTDQTTIEYALPQSQSVTLAIYNSLGQIVNSIVSDEKQLEGNYQFIFHRNHLPNGLYFCKLRVGNKIQTHKITIVD